MLQCRARIGRFMSHFRQYVVRSVMATLSQFLGTMPGSVSTVRERLTMHRTQKTLNTVTCIDSKKFKLTWKTCIARPYILEVLLCVVLSKCAFVKA